MLINVKIEWKFYKKNTSTLKYKNNLLEINQKNLLLTDLFFLVKQLNVLSEF